MQNFLSSRFQTLNIFILTIVIIVAISLQKFLISFDEFSNLFIIIIVTFVSFFSYGTLIGIFYTAVNNIPFLLKLYWDRFYLHGFWYYSYTIKGDSSGKVYFGYWKFEQNLYGTRITGYGLDENFRVRTRLTSVTQIIDNNNKFEVSNSKVDIVNPEVEFYSKTSMSFKTNPEITFLKNRHPVKFIAFTTIYGGISTGKIHNDEFIKIENARSEDCVVEILKEKFNNTYQ